SNVEDRNDCTDLRKSQDECSLKKEIFGKKKRSNRYMKVVSTVDSDICSPYSKKLDDETTVRVSNRDWDDNILQEPIESSKDSNVKSNASENKELEVLDQKEVTPQKPHECIICNKRFMVIVVSIDTDVFISASMPTNVNRFRKHLFVKII
ncbi:hypothetical protein NPIL_569041, partial [Nephila pilipes]